EDIESDRQGKRGFRCGNDNDKKGHHLPVDSIRCRVLRESNEVEARRVQEKLEAHQHRHGVSSGQDDEDSKAKDESAHDQIVGEAHAAEAFRQSSKEPQSQGRVYHGILLASVGSSLARAMYAAPTMATRRSTETASKGKR